MVTPDIDTPTIFRHGSIQDLGVPPSTYQKVDEILGQNQVVLAKVHGARGDKAFLVSAQRSPNNDNGTIRFTCPTPATDVIEGIRLPKTVRRYFTLDQDGTCRTDNYELIVNRYLATQTAEALTSSGKSLKLPKYTIPFIGPENSNTVANNIAMFLAGSQHAIEGIAWTLHANHPDYRFSGEWGCWFIQCEKFNYSKCEGDNLVTRTHYRLAVFSKEDGGPHLERGGIFSIDPLPRVVFNRIWKTGLALPPDQTAFYS